MTWASGKRAISAQFGLFLASLLALAGCGREEIHSYTEPKDTVAPQLAQNPAPSAAPDEIPAPMPDVAMRLPPGWAETALDPFSVKTIIFTNSDHQVAKISISRLGTLAGREAALVNLWREQVEQPQIPDDEAVKSLRPMEFVGMTGSYFEVSGITSNGPQQILTVFSHRPDGSWFCKLSGTSSNVVAQEKPAFLEFIKSVQLKDAPAAPAASIAASTPTQFNWKVPPQWQAVAAGDMQSAKFEVAGPGGTTGEVSVSIFPNEAGGTLTNINRWRTKFVGLDTVTEKELPQLVTPLDPALAGSVLVDMKKDNKQLIGAIVPRGGQYWYYKIVGDPAAVTPQKDAFVAFAKSTP